MELNEKAKQIFIVQPSGFCAGVTRAIRILDQVLATTKKSIYVRHQIIHNRRVVRDYEAKGVVFVDDITEVPRGAVLVLSSHGTESSLIEKAKKKGLVVIDAVCPLVTKVHNEAVRLMDDGYFVMYIGYRGHQEAEGVLGEMNKERCLVVESAEDAKQCELGNEEKIAVLTQTTLNYDKALEIIKVLQERYPNLKLPPGGDICYATKGRQAAAIELAKKVDVVVVVGSKESSNSNKLKDRVEEIGVRGYLVDDVSQINHEWFEGKEKIGVTAGASAPDYLIEEVIGVVKSMTGAQVLELVIKNDEVEFSNMPKELGDI